MKTRVAIYGFGRLGRAVYTVAAKRSDLEIVAIATEASPEEAKRALDEDYIYGSIKRHIATDGASLVVDGKSVVLVSPKLAKQWQQHDVMLVIDCQTAQPVKESTVEHQKAGAKHVVYAAASEEVQTVALAVNEEDLKNASDAISCGDAAWCAVGPIREILSEVCGVEHSLVTTVDGSLECSNVGDCDCGEQCNCEEPCSCDDACTCSTSDKTCKQVPTEIPAPTLVASMTELVFVSQHVVTAAKINEALVAAAKEPYYQGIITTSEAHVKADQAIGESASALVDLAHTKVEGGHLASVKIWYDREWSYANRIVEVTADYAKFAGRSSS